MFTPVKVFLKVIFLSTSFLGDKTLIVETLPSGEAVRSVSALEGL